MKIIIDKKENLEKLVSEEIINLVKEKKNVSLGLATGSTPLGVYANLVEDFKLNKTDYSHVRTYNLDEYKDLPLDHEQSYHTFMDEKLFNFLNVKKENIHFPTEATYKNYSKLLKENQIDLQILGIGTNAHIAFNEPGSSFESITGIVPLAEQTRDDNKRFFNSINEVPTHAYSMGLKDILMAKKIVLIAFGKSKSEAIFQLVKGSQSTHYPATILQNHPNVVIYIDEDAASLIK